MHEGLNAKVSSGARGKNGPDAIRKRLIDAAIGELQKELLVIDQSIAALKGPSVVRRADGVLEMPCRTVSRRRTSARVPKRVPEL